MKKVLLGLTLAIVLILSWVIPAAAYDLGNNYGGSWGNSGYTNTSWSTSFFYKIGEGTVTAQLLSGKTNLGTVTVWEPSSGKINIQYDTVSANLTKTALFIGRGTTYNVAESKILPNKYGNYNLDNFTVHNGPFTDPTTDIFNVTETGSGNWLCIAAYAELISSDGTKKFTAWGDLVPVSQWKLPTSANVSILSIPSSTLHYYLDLLLSNVNGGNSFHNGTYTGWCGDESTPMNGTPSARVFSSLNLSGADRIKWNRINYIINHRDPGADPSDDTAFTQFAIWYFTNNDSSWLEIPQVKTLVVSANSTYGAGFVPGPGQVAAVIFDPGVGQQLVFIELCTPTCGCNECSCHYSCSPNWSPCQNWQPDAGSPCNWNPCFINDHHDCNQCTSQFHWSPNCSPKNNGLKLLQFCNRNK